MHNRANRPDDKKLRFLISAAISVSIASIAFGQQGATTSVAAPPEFPSPSVPESIGLNNHFYKPSPAGAIEQLAAGGWKWLRIDYLWAPMEKMPGVYDFSAWDQMPAMCDSNQMRAIIVMAYGNKLYDGGQPPHTDAGRKAYAAWAAASAKHFAGHHFLWEIWNEPNGWTFWRPRPDANAYAALALETCKEMKSAAPDEAIVGPALSKNDLPFLRTCFEAGLLNYWSAVTFHPYRDAPPETAANDYEAIRRLIHQYAPPGKDIPVICGEWGYASVGSMTPDQQGQYIAREYLSNLECRIPVSIWYDWHDDGRSPSDSENHFGVVTWTAHPGREPLYDPKPSYIATQTLTKTLSGFRFNKRLAIGDPHDHVDLYDNNGACKLVAWTEDSPHDVIVPTSTGDFADIGRDGSVLPNLTADAHGLGVYLTNDPQYLTPAATNDLLDFAAAWETPPADLFAAGQQNLTIATSIENPTDRSIQVSLNGAANIDLGPKQSGKLSILKSILRTQSNDPFPLTLTIQGIGSVTQNANVVIANALHVALNPVGDHALSAEVINESKQPFDGTISFALAGDSLNLPTTDPTTAPLADPSANASPQSAKILGSAPLHFDAGQETQTVLINVSNPIPPVAMLDAQIHDASGVVVADSAIGCQTQLADALAKRRFAVYPNKQQAFAAGDAPEAPPTLRGPVMRFDYHLEAQPPKPLGTTAPAAAAKGPGPTLVISISPTGGDATFTHIDGQPTALVLWIYGDASGNTLISRFVDAAGEVFQNNVVKLDWKGWRAVRLTLNDPFGFHFGGPKQDIIHYPIHWHTLLLLESPTRAASAGTLYIASPTVVYDPSELTP